MAVAVPLKSYKPVWTLLALQLAIGLIGTLALAGWSQQSALGFAAGSSAIAAGHGVYGWWTSRGRRVIEASQAFIRLLLGLALKWLLIAAALVLAFNLDGLAAPAVLAGALSAYLAYLIYLPWLHP
jgi:F0F1-type ATP synthase assembly protein I